METLKDILRNTDTAETLKFHDEKLNEWVKNGWVKVGNETLRDSSVSYGARFLYILLLSRLFGKQFTYPGQDTLASEMNVGRTSITRFIKELKASGYIIVKRRGQGKTNIYYLTRI